MRCGRAERCAEQAFRRPAREVAPSYAVAARAVSDLFRSQYARSACSRAPPSPNVVCRPSEVCSRSVLQCYFLCNCCRHVETDWGDVCTSTVLDAACFCECQCMPTLAVEASCPCLSSLQPACSLSSCGFKRACKRADTSPAPPFERLERYAAAGRPLQQQGKRAGREAGAVAARRRARFKGE